MTLTPSRRILFSITVGLIIWGPFFSFAQQADQRFTLYQTIETALKANLEFQRSQEDVEAAEAIKKGRMTEFFPTLNAKYRYINRDDETTQALGTGAGPVDVIVNPDEEYNFVTSFSQPLFTGFALLNQYEIASLGLDVAEFSKKLTRQDVILDAKNAYYSILKAQKLVDVAEDTVRQITAQKEVAENMHQVGMSPLNDLLQSQVRLANAKQELITAQNNLENAKAQFNTLLRRPVNDPVAIAEIIDYTAFDKDIEYCLAEAKDNRLEIEVAALDVEIAERDYKLSQRDYFPSLNLTGTYTRRGTDWDVDGGEGIGDDTFWDIQALANWDFWEWGRTRYGVKERLTRLSQAKLREEEIIDNIKLEVKQAYLKTIESERNIVTIEKAIEQAKENLRITEERYKEHVSTTTDVLAAQTLFTQTMTNYYTALYNFKIAKAVLYRAMGQEVLE
jgi:outer membrane protein TolC